MKKICLLLILLCGYVQAQNVTFIHPNFNVSGTNLNISLTGFPCAFTATSNQVLVELGTGINQSQFVSYWQAYINTPVTNTTSNTFWVLLPASIQCNSMLKITRICGANTTIAYATNRVFTPAPGNQFLSPSGQQTICSGNGLTDPLISTIWPNSSYYWVATNDNPNITGESLTFQNNDSITNNLVNNSYNNQQVNYSIFVNNSNSCGIVNVNVIPITPETPVISVTNGSAQFCEGTSIALDVSGNLNSAQNTPPCGWYNGSTPVITGTGVLVSNTGSYTYVNNNGCGTSVSNTINTVSISNPSLTSSTNFEICTGENTNYLLVANEPCNFTWTANSSNISGETNSGSGNSINDLLTNNTSSNQGIAYHINLVSQVSGCTKNQNVIIQVKPTPILSSISNTSICSGDALNILLSSNVATSTYSWIAQNSTNVFGESTVLSNSSTITDTLINNTSTDIPVDYAVNAITECGTSPTENFTITVRASPQPIILASGPLEFCDGGFVNLTLNQAYNSYNWSNGISGSSSISIEQTEDVSVNVTDQYGCVGMSSIIQVIEYPIPTPTISYSSGVLSSNYPTGNQWNLNNQPILGANQNTYTPNTNGYYSLTVTIDGCSGNSSSVYYGSASLSENNPNPFSIHPNPATNQVIISSQFFTENEVVQIFNTAGQLVLEYPNLAPQHQTYTINVEQLNPGIYFIQIGEMTQKLIIE